MQRFERALAERRTDPAGRRWVFVPYDQLTDRVGPLAQEAPRSLGIVMVESRWKAGRRPYHKQKLALVLANMRHFALEQADRGVALRYVHGEASYGALLRPVLGELGPARVMQPAERELRRDLAPLVDAGLLEVVPHDGWLTTPAQFAALGEPPWRMDTFYRQVRRDTGVLMEEGRPAGGRFSFDAENRKPWRGEPPAPKAPRFVPDGITREVAGLVDARFADHPGEVDLSSLPATRRDAARQWRWARRMCLEHFGPFEDAMSTRSSGLFHTRISALMNIGRLLPGEVLDDVLGMSLPLASKEGFVRQVLGWREFVRHVHDTTDGFRRIGPRRVPASEAGGARPSYLGARGDLPPAFWGRPSGLACLDRVVADVWKEAYGHHITRLMVLGNLGTLLDVSPRALTDWFWTAYADAFEWVVEPNVLAMATFGAGPVMTTKPYVSGAPYIDRMSDYCADCAFDPKRNCPITRLYWQFLARKQRRLTGTGRLAMPLRTLAKRTPAARREDQRVYGIVRRRLAAGEPVRVEDIA